MSSYGISWATEFNQSKSRDIISSVEINKLGWLRSPDSSEIIPIVFTKTADINIEANYEISNSNTYIDDEIEDIKFCFSGVDGKVASIVFSKDSKIDVIFDDGDCR